MRAEVAFIAFESALVQFNLFLAQGESSLPQCLKKLVEAMLRYSGYLSNLGHLNVRTEEFIMRLNICSEIRERKT